MIRVKTCLVAERIVIDRDSGQVSGFGVLEGLRVTTVPLSLPHVAFFCLLERGESDPERIVAQFSATLDGQQIAGQTVDIDFMDYRRARCTIRLNELSLSGPGRLALALALPGGEVAEWALEVVAAPTSRPAVHVPVRYPTVTAGTTYHSGWFAMSLGPVKMRDQ